MKPKHFILTLLALFTSITASAYELWTDGNGTEWAFEINGEDATITNRGTFYDVYIPCISGNIPSNLTIPSTVYVEDTPYTVTSIGWFGLTNLTGVTSITIPNSITFFDAYAFCNCTSITSVSIPEGITAISEAMFNGCTNLTSINLPSSVTFIGVEAFAGCSSLTSINIPNGVTSIGMRAFHGCTSLTAITFPDCINVIEPQVFQFCSRLSSFNIPDGVTTIGPYAFFGCSDLTSMTIPDGVTYIGTAAFDDCTSLTHINFTSTSPKTSFGGSTSELILIVPDVAVEAYKEAWPEQASRVVPVSSSENWYNVEVTAKDKESAVIEEIGEENALNVVNLKVTGSINSYDVMVFRNKTLNLRNLDLSDATIIASDYNYYENQYKTKDNIVTSYFVPSTLKSLILPSNITAFDEFAFKGCRFLTSLTIPNNVVSIGNCAFEDCYSLRTINLPNSIPIIPDYIFRNCEHLQSINIPKNIESIGDGAFSGCSNLTSVDLPNGLKSIGNNAFERCNITSIKLPPFLEYLGWDVFNGCSKLNDITVLVTDYLISVNEDAFSTYTTAELKIPRFLYKDYYYSEGGWKRFINIVKCDLEPGDYEVLPTNSDTSISDNDEIIPKIDENTPIDGEINNEGSITVTDDVTDTQEFDEVVQNLDGEGQGGSIIGENDNLSVNLLRVKINVKAGRWYFFSFPFDVIVAACDYPGQYAWRWYDCQERATNGSGGWKPVTGTMLNAGQGYAFQTSHTGNLIVTFNHPTFGGDKPKPLEAYASGNQANANWNFVGNPYSSFYDFMVIDFDGPITVYNSNGTYSAYRPGDDDIHLQPYEAFFVQSPTEVSSIFFDSDRRESYRKSEEKKANRIAARRARGINPQRRLINLEILSGDEQIDKTRVVLNNEKSHSYELECDAAKMMSNEARAQLYSLENGINMAINERPIDGDIRLGYTAKTAGRLSINAPRMDMPMVLVDTQLGTTFDLSLGTYDFETTAGTFNGRFLLRPSGEATAINAMTAKTGVAIGTQDGGIAIGGAEGKTVNVYTTGGALATQHDGNGHIALKSGVYVVSVDGVSAKVRVR